MKGRGGKKGGGGGEKGGGGGRKGGGGKGGGKGGCVVDLGISIDILKVQ